MLSNDVDSGIDLAIRKPALAMLPHHQRCCCRHWRAGEGYVYEESVKSQSDEGGGGGFELALDIHDEGEEH